MNEKIKILYVDDEEQNLVSFRANFRKTYDVFTAISAEVAFELLKEHNIPIVISDQRMPKMSGVEFLEKVFLIYPDSIRLLITGQSDIETVIEAINRGQVSKYIQKPWDWDKLSMAIDHCVTIYTSRIELKLKNDELTKANDELNKFVYSVSHDLRSPLTSILGIINLVKVSPELKVAEEHIKMIEGRVLKLDSFIKNIINYYKNARLENFLDKVDLNMLMSEVLDDFKELTKGIQINLKFEIKSDFIGDLFRLRVVLENLISNAIKYQKSSSDFKKIDIYITVDSENLHISISDNGVGIDEKYLQDIFKLFFRIGESYQVEGNGIGLYLVNEAVVKMGGKIDVESILSKETSFKVVIPNKH